MRRGFQTAQIIVILFACFCGIVSAEDVLRIDQNLYAPWLSQALIPVEMTNDTLQVQSFSFNLTVGDSSLLQYVSFDPGDLTQAFQELNVEAMGNGVYTISGSDPL